MHRRILQLSIPNILSNLSVPLLGMVDTALMGRMESEIYLGAIALGSVVFNFIYWGFGFLRMGTTGITAQAFGKGDETESISVLARALIIAGMGSLALIVVQSPIESLGFGLIEGEENVKNLAREYFRIRIYAAPATIGLYAFHGWFLGMQNARYPMWLTIIVNILNIGFNVAFVYGWGMKSDGVALGTVLAQYGGLLLAIGLFMYRYGGLRKKLNLAQIRDTQALRHFFGVNADIFVRTMCLIFVFAFFTSKSSGISTIVLAANQILLQLFSLLSFGVDGFAFAAESLVGLYKGEGNTQKLKEVIRKLLYWGVGLGVLFSAIYGIAGSFFLALFTDQEAVLVEAKQYLFWMMLIPLAGSFAFMWDGVFIGATATRAMRNTMLVATFMVFLPAYYLTYSTWGNHGLWLAMLVFMIFRAVSLGALVPRLWKEEKKVG